MNTFCLILATFLIILGIVTTQREDLVMTKRIDKIQRDFAFYGFTACPLSRRKIAKLICKGLTDCQIFRIGCDACYF